MPLDYINEAFKRLDILEEEMFSVTSSNGINELNAFLRDDDSVYTVRVVDPEASSDEQLQDSYIGKAIINCNVCHSHIFSNKDDILISEDSGFANTDMTCPYCGEAEGFTIIGEISEYGHADADDVENNVVADEQPEDSAEPLEPSENEETILEEDFKEVSITTEDQHMEMSSDESGKVVITTEPVVEDTSVQDENIDEVETTLEDNTPAEETIIPVSVDTEEEILVNSDISDDSEESLTVEDEVNDSEPTDVVPETSSEEEAEETNNDVVIDIEDIDEESLDELSENYFKRVYENVASYKTTNAYQTQNKIIIEGLISFVSGSTKKTGFVFEGMDTNSRGQVRFVGSNKHLSESTDAFTLVGKLDNNKLFLESLKYKYTSNDTPVRGIVRRK